MTNLAKWMILTGFLYYVPTAEGARCGNNDNAGSNDPKKADDNVDSGNGYQFVSTASKYTIDCCGVVDGWTFYVKNTGTVNVQIWRDAGGSTYTLIGSSQYTYTSDQFETTETLSSAEYIPVKSGDVIGWYSPGVEIISYRWGGFNGNNGQYEATNTLVTVGNTMSTPASTYTYKEYGIEVLLGSGNSPTFSNLPATVTIACHSATAGDLVYTITATDNDVVDTLTITMDSVTPSAHFGFDSSTGQVTLTTSSVSITSYSLSFTVSDGCTSQTRSLTANVANTVPYFSNLPGTASTGCFSPAGTVVFTVVPTDDDGVSDTTTMSLSSITPSAHFAFDTATGVVTVSSSLTIGTYTMTFSVTDLCGQSSTSTLTITVTDNVPYFSNLPGTVSTGCFSPAGTVVFTVVPTDDDGVSDTTTMSLSSITPSAHFAFDTATGVVTVSSSLTIGTYTMTFSVTDLCGQSSTSTLTITVTDNVPYFSNLPGTASTGCFSPAGTVVFTVVPTDDDGVSDTTTMSLSSIIPSTDFAFNAATGVVTVSSASLTIGTYTMTFSVTDLCGQSSTSTLTITVTDNDPTFTNLDGSVSVGCYSPVGTNIYTVTSADGDTASGDSVTMTFNSLTPAAHFDFNTITGQVTVLSSALIIGSYSLSAIATDTCGRTATNSLAITVIDSDPYFSNLDGSANVGCYSPLGTAVFTVTSGDGDTAVGDSITMTLDSTTPSSDFGFDSTAGVVTVSSPSLALGNYVMTFTVTDSCGQSATNALTLTVIDTTPYFSNLNAIITSVSSVIPGDVLYTVTSLDADSVSGDSVTTTLDSVTPFPHFVFDSSTGQVSVSSTLTIADYVLTFVVTDSCGQNSTKTLTISVYNRAPVIMSLPTTVDVREDETSSQLLHTVAVNDADGHAITCSISDSVPPSAPFEMKFINTGTGLDNGIYLSLSPGLDYTTWNTYTLTINCTDNYDYDTNNLYVYIVANGMPLISNLQNTTSVSTTTVMNSEVFAVLTTDLENNQLSFSLNCTNTATCPFTIYSTGRIMLSQTLLGTTTLAYELDITVSDSYSTSAAHRLTVFVSDLNTAPVLANLPKTIQVSEDITPGTTLFLVSVYDGDLDVNFTFDVITTPSDGATKFVLSDATKTISLSTTQSLDYETTSQYTLNISVSDGTESSPFAALTVQVADVNEPPTLGQTHYYIARDEGTAGTSFNHPSVYTSDPDTGDSLTFSFGNGSSLNCGLLSINVSTGVMGYASDYDVDNSNLSSYFTCIIKVEDTGGLAATATATLSIRDVNDNQPKFTTNNNIVVSARKSTAIGTVLTVVSVRDNDLTGVNRELSFTLTQSAYYFDLKSSGQVTLAGDLSVVPDGMVFNVTIAVKNVGYSVSDTTVVFLKVVEDESGGFWSDSANIAWVSLVCVAGLALIVAVSALMCKYPPKCKGPKSRAVKVKPANSKPQPLPRENFMKEHPYKGRTLTPTDVNVGGRWDAWASSWG